MKKCIICGKQLVGQQRKYCSAKCNMKRYNSTPRRKASEKNRQYSKNKFIKKPGDKLDQSGSNNPNWKGGISKNHMRYRREFIKNNPEKVKVNMIAYAARRRGDLIPEPCIICGNEKVDMHHQDYTKPFDVDWLCRSCHNLVNISKIDLKKKEKGK